jgi:hypothetical protein
MMEPEGDMGKGKKNAKGIRGQALLSVEWYFLHDLSPLVQGENAYSCLNLISTA